MLYAAPRSNEDAAAPVTYADTVPMKWSEPEPPALAPVFQPPVTAPSLPEAFDMRRALAPVSTQFYVARGLNGSREEFYSGGLKTTSSTLQRIQTQNASYYDLLTKDTSDPSGSLVPVNPVAPDMTDPSEPPDPPPAPDGPPPVPESPEGSVAANLLREGDVAGAIEYLKAIDPSTQAEALTYLDPLLSDTDRQYIRGEIAKKPSIWQRKLVGPVTVKHAAIGVGALAAAGLAFRLLR